MLYPYTHILSDPLKKWVSKLKFTVKDQILALILKIIFLLNYLCNKIFLKILFLHIFSFKVQEIYSYILKLVIRPNLVFYQVFMFLPLYLVSKRFIHLFTFQFFSQIRCVCVESFHSVSRECM